MTFLNILKLVNKYHAGAEMHKIYIMKTVNVPEFLKLVNNCQHLSLPLNLTSLLQFCCQVSECQLLLLAAHQWFQSFLLPIIIKQEK